MSNAARVTLLNLSLMWEGYRVWNGITIPNIGLHPHLEWLWGIFQALQSHFRRNDLHQKPQLFLMGLHTYIRNRVDFILPTCFFFN